MAWTAPRTWSTGEIVSASIMNVHVRDNEIELGARTSPSTSTDEGGNRSITSTTYATFTGAPSVAVAHTTTALKVEWGAKLVKGTNNIQLGPALSGSNTLAAADTRAVRTSAAAGSDQSCSRTRIFSGLTAGTTTVALQAKVDAGTGNVLDAWLVVTPVG